MKNSWTFGNDFDPKFRDLIVEDRREIDALDKRHRIRMMFYDRMNRTLALVHKYFPDPAGIRVGDFGCAQANFGLLLAERGYEVFALDMNTTSLEYAQMKYESGKIHWINARFSEAQLSRDFLDVVIMAEVITTFAFPDQVVGKVMEFIRPGGLLIGTFPNGANYLFLRELDTYEGLLRRQAVESLPPKEDGLDHLYRLPPEQLKYMVPSGARIIEHGFCGSTWLLNKYSQPLCRLVPVSLLEGSMAIFRKVPGLSRKTSYLQYVVLRKDRSGSNGGPPRTEERPRPR